jgi:hypothetical protein
MPTQIRTKHPITDAHRQAAFSRLSWPGWTYEQARANPMRSQLIEYTAAILAKQDAASAAAKQTLTQRRGAVV